ncbi:MAG: hypothetical protein COB35_09870 [Gammaproteobacteria bacterium]|nr:MAG: hypothetical protein COB35_09870 [Gammaproteobacteria bacterium]
MKRGIKPFKVFSILIFCSLTLVVNQFAWAQTANQGSAFENKKAILIGKFVKYISWPAKKTRTQFNIGVYNDREFYDFLNHFFTDKTVIGKDIVVTLVNSATLAKQVDLLYLSSLHRRKLPKLAGLVNGDNVLLISENSKDVASTMINLLTNKENSKITVKINNTNIQNAKLTIPNSSFFLDSADDNKIFTLRQTTIDRNNKNAQFEQYKQTVAAQYKKITQLNKTLKSAQQKSAKYDIALQKQLGKISILQKSATEKEKSIKNTKQKLATLTAELKVKEQQLQMNKEENSGVEKTNDQQQTTQITNLEHNLNKQKELMNAQMKKLKIAHDENQQLSMYSGLFYFILVLSTAVIAFMVWHYKKLKEQKSALSKTLVLRDQQLIKSENVASLGYLATDITYSVGDSLDDLFEHYIKIKDEKSIEALKPIVILLNNLNHIAADQDEMDKQSIDIAAYVNKVMTLFNVEFQQSEINYSYSGESKLEINSIPSQIALIFFNLVNNSIKHGFNNKGKGKISISIEKTSMGKAKRDGAKITYQDDGSGMDEYTKQQIFEPFFTTKPERGYLGLGMSTMYDLVNNKLGGSIKVDSQLGKGVTITLIL